MIVFCLPEPFFAFLSARFCLRLLAATFLVCLPPLSLFPIVTSRPTTETAAIPNCPTLRIVAGALGSQRREISVED